MLETWKIRRRALTELNYFTLLRQIIKGIPFNLISPLHAGQIFGRLHKLSFQQGITMTENNILASVCQNFIHLICGIIGLYLLKDYWMPADFEVWSKTIIVLLTLYVAVMIIVITYFDRIKTIIYKKLTSIFKEFHLLNTTKFSRDDISFILLLSFFRYSVYVGQFVIILSLFTTLPGTILIPGTCVLFLIQTFIQLPVFLTVMTRGILASYLFLHMGISNENSQIASWLIFLINLGIPSIFACYFIWKDNKYVINEKI